MHRRPAVAGQFYPGSKKSLEKELRRFLEIGVTPQPATAVIAPHAGYVYSGAVAGAAFARVEVPKRCIVLSPNHTGMGARAAVMGAGSWELPTGTIPVDEPLADRLLTASTELVDDASAHLAEHSLEVELPFLLARQPELSIVPITLAHLGPDACEEIGTAIAEVMRANDEPILIVASTDMNHYEDQSRTLEKDRLAIDRVLAMDPKGLLATCAEHRISMCGVVPTAIALWAALGLGATSATLIEHATSGDVSGDYDAVVGYAAFVIS